MVVAPSGCVATAGHQAQNTPNNLVDRQLGGASIHPFRKLVDAYTTTPGCTISDLSHFLHLIWSSLYSLHKFHVLVAEELVSYLCWPRRGL